MINTIKHALQACFILCLLSSCITAPSNSNLPDINSVIAGLSSPDVIERANSADQAGAYYDHPDKALLIPYLVEALQEPDCGWECSRVRVFAAQSIRHLQMYDEQAIQILVSWLTEPGHLGDELIQAIQAIEAFSDTAPDSTESLIYIMEHVRSSDPNHSQIKAAAAKALSRFEDRVVVKVKVM